MDYPRSAPSYFTSTQNISGISLEATIRCCVRIPLRAFRRFRRICRGPEWDSTVPWFDRQLQVESQGFALPFWHRVSDTLCQNKSSRWLTSCARQPYQRSIRLSPSPGGAQTRQTEINYAFCRASKRRAASIACARILSGSYPHSFAI